MTQERNTHKSAEEPLKDSAAHQKPPLYIDDTFSDKPTVGVKYFSIQEAGKGLWTNAASALVLSMKSEGESRELTKMLDDYGAIFLSKSRCDYARQKLQPRNPVLEMCSDAVFGEVAND